SYGRAFIVLMLLSRIFSFSLGCGPRDGTIGGKCTTHTDDCTGRTTDQYCEDGVCDQQTSTCVAVPVTTPPPRTPECIPGDRGDCFANQILFACSDDASPDALDCAQQESTGPGNASYCCTPPPSSCAGEDASLCSTPSQFFDCLYPLAPAVVVGDPSLRCALLASYPGQDSFYCCASGNACFSAPDDWDDSCDGRTPYFCPGSAAPDAGNCERVIAQSESNGLEAYCCDAPPVVRDAGGD
ncbi:MAG: hypothetical protein ACREJX_11585, partial [Polyangiaceae bacterium]